MLNIFRINNFFGKSSIFCPSTIPPLHKTVTETIYLGQLISTDNTSDKEVTRRTTLATRKYWSLKHIFEGNFSNNKKSEIFNVCGTGINIWNTHLDTRV